MLQHIDVIVGHQGGWDEIFLFVVPIVVALAAVRWVEKRNRARTRNGVTKDNAPIDEDAVDG